MFVKRKYLYLNILFFFLIITISLPKIVSKETSEASNASKQTYDYEDDEDEVDRKKRKNETFIIILNDSNYTSIIEKYEALFIIFYPSPCTSCKTFMPHYVRLSHYIYEKKINLKFAKVSGPNNTELVNKYKIQTFPSIILLYQNRTYYYNLDIN